MADPELNTKVGADVSGFVSGMNQAQGAMQGLLAGNFSGLASGFAGVGAAAGPLLAVAGAGIAIAEAFSFMSESVEEAVKWNLEAGKLSRQLGITTQDASVLANALEDHGVSIQSYTGAANFMTKALVNGSVGFKNLEVETKNADGSFRNSQDLMGEVIDRLNRMPDSTEKNIIVNQIFGRGLQANRDILIVGKKALEETAAQMERLGTTVTPQAEAASRAYSLALADVHDVLAAFAINLGTAIIPALTDLLHWFSGVGTTAVEGFRSVLGELKTDLSLLGESSTTLGETINRSAAPLGHWSTEGTKAITVSGEINIFIKQMAMLMESALTVLANFTEGISSLGAAISNTAGNMGAAIGGAFKAVWGDSGKGFAEAMGDVRANYRAGEEQITADAKAAQSRAEANAEAHRLRMLQIRYGVGVPVAGEGYAGAEEPMTDRSTKKVDTGKDKSGERVKEWTAELDKLKLAEENWFTWDTNAELKFWQGKLKLTKENTDANKAVLHKVAELKKKSGKEERDAHDELLKGSNDDQQAAADQEIADYKATLKAKEQALIDATEREKDHIKGKTAVEKTLKPDDTGIAESGVIAEKAAEQSLADALRQLRAEELAGVVALEQKKYEAHIEGLEKRRGLAGLDMQAQQNITNQEVKAEADLNKKKGQLADAFRAGEAKDEMQAAKRQIDLQVATDAKIAEKRVQTAKEIEGYLQPFVTGFSNGLKKILDGSLSLGDAVKGMGKMLVGAFTEMIGALVMKLIQALATMAAQWVATLIFGQTTEEAANAARIATGVATRTSEASGMAAVLAVNAAASAAAVPFTGWLAWPAVMAAAYAAGMGMVPLAAAAGGFDVPAGMNPITQLHAEEMVLPAGLAKTVRGMARTGEVATVGGGGAEVNFHISAVDGPSVARFFRSNQDALAKVIRQGIRDGKGRKR